MTTTGITLAEQALSDIPAIRRQAAMHRKCPLDLLLTLAVDENPGVAHGARRNPNFPVEWLTDLVKGTGVWQRISQEIYATRDIFYFPNAPTEALELFYKRYPTVAILQQMLIHPSCPESLLRIHAVGSSLRYRILVSRNTSIPLDLIPALLRDSSKKVRSAIVRNTSVPEDLIMPSLNDPTAEVLRAVVARTKGSNRRKAVAKLAEHNGCAVNRRIVATYTNNKKLANRLCWDANPAVRTRALRNSASGEEGHVAASLINGSV